MTIRLRNSAIVSPFSREGGAMASSAVPPASTAWPAANRAYYHPIRLDRPALVRKLWWLNGAAVGDNAQVGIYRPDGADGGPGSRLVAGSSIVTSGTNDLQFDDITDVTIGAGAWWIALWASGTTSAFFAISNRFGSGAYLQSSLSGGLPATATPAALAASALVPMFGLYLRSTP